jgi:hypothetical protein
MNTKLKLLNCNANIYFNKTCLELGITPKYAHTKINSRNKTFAKQIENKIHKLRIKNEIKLWYAKKQNLYKTFYYLHIQNGKECGNLWDLINKNISNKLEIKINIKYRNINNKIKKLKEQQKTCTQNTDKQTTHTFYKHTKNLTIIIFTDTEMQLLNKGLKYNLHHKHKKLIQTLAIEADTAISQLPEKDQGYMRQLVVNNIQKITNKQNTTKGKQQTIYTKRNNIECNAIKTLKHKINQNQLIITKADKGNKLVILYKDDYNRKIEEFINKNNFTKLPHDITNKLQQTIRNKLNKYSKIINTYNKWKYINLNPRAPQIHGTVKLHEHDKPIRPIVNWKESPGYNTAKHLNTLLSETLKLPNAFNIKNTHHLT